MPKERFHLLVADRTLPTLSTLSGKSPATGSLRLAFFLGAISPDTLFYDLPSFRYAPASAALHRLEGPAGVRFLGSLITDCRSDLTTETRMWLLGVALHLLTDGFWHQIIEEMASFLCRNSLPGSFYLSRRQAHHWVESELEGFWLDRIGPPDGYRQMLKDFSRPGKTREACNHCFHMLLKRLTEVEVPAARRIGRCCSWQAFLLRQFSLPGWSRTRDLLLRFRLTRFWGTLIVPLKAGSMPISALERVSWQCLNRVVTPVDGCFEDVTEHPAGIPCNDIAESHQPFWQPSTTQAGSNRASPLENAFSDQVMARSLSYFMNQLLSLATRL